MTWLLFALAVLVVLALAGFFLSTPRIPVTSRPFMTANELEFLARLEAAVPELRFHAQVSMGALLRPAHGESWKVRNMFSQKIVDYVGQRRDTGQVHVLVELDDRSHDPARDAARDAVTAAAGYRTVRVPSRPRPDQSTLCRLVWEALLPG